MTVATVDQVAKKLGVDASKIKQWKGAYVGMAAQMGVFVRDHIGRYRAETQLTEDDLGIKLTEKDKKWIRLGAQKILPPEIVKRMDQAEGAGRSNVKKHALNLMMGEWIPVTAWKSYEKENEILKGEFFDLRDEIVKDYPKLMKKVEVFLFERAKKIYSQLEQKPDDSVKWMESFVKRVIGRAKTAEEVKESFTWEMQLEWLPAPSTMADEKLKLEKIDVERKKIQSEQAKLQSEEKVRWAVEQDKLKQMRQVNDLYIEQERKKREATAAERDKFVADVMKQLREALLGGASSVLTSMSRNSGKLLGANVKQLERTIERGRMLNFMNDGEIEAYYAEIEAELGKASTNRRTRNVKDICNRIQDKMTPSVRALEGTTTAKEEELCRIIADGIGEVRSIE
jgi:hypothetical protein